MSRTSGEAATFEHGGSEQQRQTKKEIPCGVRISIIAKIGSTIGVARPWTATPAPSVATYMPPITITAVADQIPK